MENIHTEVRLERLSRGGEPVKKFFVSLSTEYKVGCVVLHREDDAGHVFELCISHRPGFTKI